MYQSKACKAASSRAAWFSTSSIIGIVGLIVD